MITGFNTDIEYQGVTYHVQTEDKGMKTPLILSLVYNRGTILASKRSPYNDLLNGEFDENQLAERLQKQHKLICAAIRAGRLEDLKQMTAKAAAEKQNASKTESAPKLKAEQAVPPVAAPAPEKVAVEETAPAVETRQRDEIKPLAETAAPKVEAPKSVEATKVEKIPEAPAIETKTREEKVESPAVEFPVDEGVWEIPLSVLEEAVILDDVQVIEEEMIVVAPEAVQIIEESEKTAAVESRLKIEMLDNIVFKSGERKALALIVRRGNHEKGVEGAHVMVKITGTSFRPLIFHSKTDENGTAVVHLQLPHFRAGRAGVLIKAMSGGEEVEVRRAIHHD